MAFGLLDDEFHINEKIVGLTDPEFRLYVCGITYCRKKRTRGFISAAAAGDLARLHRIRNYHQVTARLEKRPAWAPVEGGWHIHDWEDMPYDRISEAARKGGVASGTVRVNRGSTAVQPNANRTRTERQPRARTPSPSPSPTPPDGGVIASSNEDASALFKIVFGLWAARQGWDDWNGHRDEAFLIQNWLREHRYPAKFWHWIIPQVPVRIRGFAWLVTPGKQAEAPWVEDRYSEWRDDRYQVEKAQQLAAPPVVTFMPRAMP